MLVLGIILVLIAVAIVVAALIGGRGIDQPAGFDLGAVEINPNTFSVFLAGALTVLVLVAGLGLIQAGMRRARRRRQDKKELSRLSKKVEAQESAPTASTTASTTTADSADTATTTRTASQPDTTAETTVTDPDQRSR